jgi:hypothetical protein
MSRLLIAVLSLSVLGYLAYRAMYARSAAEGAETPQQRLQNVKDSAQHIEQQGEQRVDDIDKSTRGE